MKRKVLMNTYGSAFPLKLDLDKQILSRYDFFTPCCVMVFGLSLNLRNLKEVARCNIHNLGYLFYW